MPTCIQTRYTIETDKIDKPITFAVISDLHNEEYDHLLPMLEGVDALLVPGDISDRYRQTYQKGIDFLREASQIVPTYFSLGNHETRQETFRKVVTKIRKTGAIVLINRFVTFEGILIGGYYDPSVVRERDCLRAFCRREPFKLLMCHQPHMYPKRLKLYPIDLVVSGHAHGGQIRIGNQGIYAPGQGMFPRYTHGLIDDRLIVTAGVGNPARAPRWGNPREVVYITLTPKRISHTNET